MAFASMKTEGIVLYSAPFKEADKVYRMLTKDYGKVSVRGRGALKPKAKLASHLESPGVVAVEYVRGKYSTTVIATDFRKPFTRLQQDVERRLAAQSILTLVDRYTDEEEHDDDLYALVRAAVKYLDDEDNLTPAQILTHVSAFLVKFLAHSGYQLEFDRCLNCKSDIHPMAFRWHGGKGGLVCTSCASQHREEWFAAARVPDAVIDHLRTMHRESFSTISRLTIEKPALSALAGMIHDSMMLHLPGRERAPFWEGLLIRLERPAFSL